ncbi:hypothetical protein Rs2_12963 [Raphanus sativus]|nr:hypothetical protein Rs2_12963 [Raphanus sativus]
MRLTIFFAILMAFREHRAKLKRNKTTAPNRLTVAWIFNSGHQYRLLYHPYPDYSAFPLPALSVPPPPDLLPIIAFLFVPFTINSLRRFIEAQTLFSVSFLSG